ncbi:hypothetical protein HHX47_DHR9000564 [Lentinula edodes]|nr:hypothetical protein HHX47_DHR9000564 [Lentinula edodes]
MFSIFLFASYLLLTQCQSIQPAAIPLAVRSPYFQSYLSHTSTTSGTNTWPSFWTTNHTLGWSGLLRVDGTLYEWLGSAVEDGGLTIANNATAKAVTLQNYQITPTRSILSLQAGAMDINVTFLSPIEPADLALQSFPFTYIYFEASSTDGNSHSLQVYEDISGGMLEIFFVAMVKLTLSFAEWTSSSTTNIVQWNTTTSNSITYHQAQRSPFQFMTETNDMAEDATVYHVTNSMANFMNDATNALERSKTLDSKIVSDANAISSNYVDLVSLASRQLMAGLEVTVGTDSSGKLNASDILFFMKDTGNSQRTNPVEAMYASFPGILYLNASWAGYLLKPLMQLEQSGLYSLSFAAGDLGNSFPVATGNANPTVFSAMESSSDMISMMWAYATFSGDGTLISQYVR